MTRPPSTDMWRELVEPGNVWLFIPGTISLAIIGDGSYALLEGILQHGWSYVMSSSGQSQALAVLLGLLMFPIVVLILHLRLRLEQRLRETTIRPDERPATPHAGVVLLVSLTPTSPEMTIIEHHRQQLRHCWLLASQEVRAQADALAAKLEQQSIDAHVCAIADVYSVDAAYAAVKQAVQEARQTPKVGNQVIVDITGSTKLMSVGAVLACLDEGVAIEYLASQRDTVGKPIRGTEKAMEITIHEPSQAVGER